jgi:hypothetical protein
MEVVGGISSVTALLTVVVQLADGLRKLVGFWKRVQKAPAEISALIDDLESLALTLAQAESRDGECELDPVARRVIGDCHKKVLILCEKIYDNACGLDSSNIKIRKWSAFKISLDKAEIESLRRVIDRAQTTLILSKVIAIHSTQQSTLSQLQQLGQSIELCNTMQLSTLQLQKANGPQNAIKPGLSVSLVTDTLEENSSDCPWAEDPPDQTTFQAQRDLSIKQLTATRARNCLTHWERSVATPVAHIATRSITWEIPESETQEPKKIQEFRSVLYPSRGGRFLGFSHGVLVTARLTVGWKYMIEPFRAVSEDSLIFEFCKSGNVDAVRLLLQRGEASPLDRDPKGRTPLWV